MKFKIILFLAISCVCSIAANAQYVWNPISNGTDNSTSPIILTPLNNGDVYMIKLKNGLTYQFFVSQDKGSSWNAIQPSGLQNLNGFAEINNFGDQLVFLGSDNLGNSIIYTSTDNGSSWVENPISVPHPCWARDIIKLSAQKWLLAVMDYSGAEKLVIYESVDAGQTWVDINTIGLNSVGWAINFAQLNNKLYMTTHSESRKESNLYQSLDEGQNWTLMNFPFYKGNWFSDLRVRGTNEMYLATSALQFENDWNHGIYYSNDEGLTWDSLITTGKEDLGTLYCMNIIDNQLLIGGEHKDQISGSLMYRSELPLVGIKEEISQNFTVYPNPFSNQLFIDNPEYKEVVITNITGQVVLKGSGELIDTSSLAKGLYIISIGDRSQKLIKH